VEAVLVDEPSSPDALFVKSKIELSAKQPEAAVQSLRTAIDLRPDWAEAHFLLGTALVMTGERTAARTELARALELDASLIEARRILAEVHAALGEHEYAIEEGRRYLGQKPDAVTTRIRVAQSLLATGRVDAALAEVQAIDESQRDMQVDYAIGRIYLSKGDPVNARKHLMAALEAQPQNPDILGAVLQLDRREGLLESSAERINAAVAANPDDAALQKLAGTLALAQGRGADAEAAFKRAIELDPDSADASRMLAEFYARTGRTQQAIETYEQALVARPDQPQLHHLLGVLYEFGGQTDLAIQHYEEAIRYAPNQAESKNNLAYLFAESGENLDRALDLAQEAKALMPDDPNTSDTLGWVLYRRGVPTAAIGYLKEAESGMGSQGANLGLVRYHLALAYEATGDKEHALEAAGRALEGHEAWVVDQKAQGRHVEAQPPWYADAQQMKTRL
jgi:tetratricopeptide (TPR) repeat protein